MMSRVALALVLLSPFSAAETLTMLTEVTSKMQPGTAFQAQDSSGRIYSGHIVTKRARRLRRNGSMLLVFDQPVHVTNSDPEGLLRGRISKKRLMLQIGAGTLAAKLADDSIEGVIGPGRARYVGLGALAATFLISRGAEARLHVGDHIEVEESPDRQRQ
jgi:hypothetical protein